MYREPRVSWRLVVTCAALFTVLFTVQNYLASIQDIAFLTILARQTVIWSVWIVLTPFIIASARRNPFTDQPRGPWIRRQLLIGGAFSILHSIIAAVVR